MKYDINKKKDEELLQLELLQVYLGFRGQQ